MKYLAIIVIVLSSTMPWLARKQRDTSSGPRFTSADASEDVVQALRQFQRATEIAPGALGD